MAEVYRARDIRLDRIVAVKTLREDLARDATFQARFRREAQSAASLNHPSIVAVYDTGEDEAGPTHVPYIVMEYVDGRTLRELLRDDRRLLPERALEITDGVLKAMAKDPAERYQSAAEMRTDIQRALSGVPVAAPPQATEMYAPGTRQMGPGTMMAGAAATGAISPYGPDGDGYGEDGGNRRRKA